MWDILLEAVVDSLKVFPVLLVMYILIELIEHKAVKNLKYSKILNNKFSPVVSSAVGIIPQCGFSVIATDLYAKKKISVASLIAIYLATSDEALPILPGNPEGLKSVLPLLLIKFLYAVLVGYVIMLVLKITNRKTVVVVETKEEKVDKIYSNNNSETTKVEESEVIEEKEIKEVEIIDKPIEIDYKIEEETKEVGCCGHDLEHNHSGFNTFFVHPLIHSLKIFAFILIVNIVFGFLLELIGVEKLSTILLGDSVFQSFLTALIGLIPNCVSSVIITELYLLGGISFGGCLAGLSINAGLAFIVLFKENKNLKQNLLILGTTYIASVLLGILVDVVMMLV